MLALPASASPAAIVVQASSGHHGLPPSPLAFRQLSALRFSNTGWQSAGVSCRGIASRQSLLVFAAESSVKTEKWLLQPIGDGDCSHLDEAVPLPGVIELSVDTATVGRVPEKADIVIPIATVSGLHARLEKKSGTLYVTDLDSTNGTYINDRQIRPGAVTPVPPGSRVTFGDDHLAAFKFSKVEEETSS